MTHARNVLASSASVDWYTPEWLAAIAEEVLGGIELDPCTSEEANAYVCARTCWGRDDDGLAQDWDQHRTLYCNPPYGRGISRWVSKFAAYGGEGLLLVKASTSVSWFREVWRFPLCFFRKRIQFWRPSGSGSEVAAAPFDSVMAYTGASPYKFAASFAEHGHIVMPTAGGGR